VYTDTRCDLELTGLAAPIDEAEAAQRREAVNEARREASWQRSAPQPGVTGSGRQAPGIELPDIPDFPQPRPGGGVSYLPLPQSPLMPRARSAVAPQPLPRITPISPSELQVPPVPKPPGQIPKWLLWGFGLLALRQLVR
jgi:hypothetical protein